MLPSRAVAFLVLTAPPAPRTLARANSISARIAARALSTMAAARAKTTAVVWYKYSDLRVDDHEPLTAAHASHEAVVHLFVWDPLWHGATAPGGFPRCGHYRARFLLEAVADLRRSLRAAGSELVVRCGDSAAVVPAVAAAVGAASVLTHSEAATEELALQARVAAGLRAAAPGAKLTALWGGQTLYHPDDLRAAGLDVSKGLPPVYSQFRRHAEGRCTVRPPLPPPRAWRPTVPVAEAGAHVAQPPRLSPFAAVSPGPAANVGAGQLPTLAALGVPDLGPHLAPLGPAALPAWPGVDWRKLAPSLVAPAAPGGGAGASSSPSPPAAGSHADDAEVWALPRTADARGVLPFTGGEASARARLAHYFWATDGLRTYKETRNGLLGGGYSSKLSPWLAAGCVSPRTVAAEVKRYEGARVANDSTYWLLFELLWRDYFRFAPLAWGARLFHLWGPRGVVDRGREWRRDDRLLAAWAVGGTGYPFVDANMRELLLTGFQSNRGRQNVASWLARDAGLDWRLGAAWFESLLLDADPGSNYGNWTYVAGVGADPREDRYFLIPKQARDYDRDGRYARAWLPELAGAPTDGLHDPRALTAGHRGGGAYPAPVLQLLAWRQGPRGGPPTHSGPGSRRSGGPAAAGGKADRGKRQGGVGGDDDATAAYPPPPPPTAAAVAPHPGSRTSTGGGGKGKVRPGGGGRVQHL